ncbi:hypothetical protein [Bradyrhizobium prioriisuperbiae]|uniref:hypothetical protein n=1 Tax=Bradyrhizobium prioriisuperbiae TaxID=2854389 RepID=UPI0028E94183|nr:hypothetical protein [Bradyrhizobium prioritasuperba]
MKRSGHVALLLMGTAAIGGTAYSLMPSETCTPERPGITRPDGSPAECGQRSSSSSSGGGSHSSSSSGSRSSFFSSDSSSTQSDSTHAASGDAGSSHVSRGGFGSFAHSFASHFSGGG